MPTLSPSSRARGRSFSGVAAPAPATQTKAKAIHAILIRSSIHFAHDDIDAAQDHHDVSHRMSEAKIFEDGEVDEAGRPDAVTIWIRTAIADQIKAELALWALDATV